MKGFDEALVSIRATCAGLEGSYEKLSHGSPCFFVEKGKQFLALLDDHHGDGRLAVWILSTLPIQESLLSEERSAFFRPPYVGGRGWIGVELDGDVSAEELENLIQAGYELAKTVKRR